ncbi:hypothetical protein [Desulfosarcina ovata]|uniref:hypothetical protein n=1 Tax=Desulfosarcina ovata TaxID=83564 RepID=UPI002F3E57A7
MRNESINRFGFRQDRGGPHLARTIMLKELTLLLSAVDAPDVDKRLYMKAITEDNCLNKRSDRTRKISARHLAHLYGLDPEITLFRCFSYFWSRDNDGQPLLALLFATARDSILKSTGPFIQSYATGQSVTREALEDFIDNLETGRFSPATLKSTAQNIRSSWTQSGHLQGKVKKIRKAAKATPGSVSFAVLLGYLLGFRGESLYKTEYAKLLDCSLEESIELSVEASRKGWIVLKRLGSVIEVMFPNLLSKQEMEWVREQS